ncbi:helix-turn-helix transcriptional regulator [Chitinophaga qingshengii]|uniref:Helix-turn-helix transcriptional regulator n=1 Tax=Chitinophaga qingshengii TaxID=1569794 RepID=A0ABR7TXX7_9BACT|nr:helix-turn-helix transcriptional regulator [Chitinophaga qingshengii]MBC9933939.1 helix-turn-helix transcriptional regulator [Chitinophaga qingshengii]
MKTVTQEYWAWKVQLAIAYAHNNSLREINLQTVADMLSVSKDNFSHKFSRLMGEPYARYVKRTRLEAGVGYLRHSNFSITEISEKCQYSNESFSKAIRGWFNTSPTGLRNREYMPAELYTLEQTRIATASQQDFPEHFNMENTVDCRLPACTLYYKILPSGNDPVKGMVVSMARYSRQLRDLIPELAMEDARIITGTLDVVPVTTYDRMMMYVGLLLPHTPANMMAHYRMLTAYQEAYGLVGREIEEGHYKKLKVPLSFADAGLPMYKFINANCRVGHFYMRTNHFFISLPEPSVSEIYIPV